MALKAKWLYLFDRLAITKDNVEALPTLFRTYDDSSTGLWDCAVWEVARATSAATTFFKPIRVGRDDIEFIDAGLEYNNPCEVLMEEASRQFPGAAIKVLSIGTGLGDVVAIKDRRQSILSALSKMATSSQKVALRLNRSTGGSTDYFRFNVERGLEDAMLADWKRVSRIAAHTQNQVNIFASILLGSAGSNWSYS